MARTMTMAEANQIAQQRIEELERELLKYKDGQFFERYERLESQLQALREALEEIARDDSDAGTLAKAALEEK